MHDTPHRAADRAAPGSAEIPEPRPAPEVPPPVLLAVVEEVAAFVEEFRSRLTRPGEAFAGPEDWAGFVTRKALMFAVIAASPYGPPSAMEAAEEAAIVAAEAWRMAAEARRQARHAADHAGRVHGESVHGESTAGDRRVGA